MATKIVATAFGGPEVLSQVEADVSAPAEGEVTVAVKAAPVNPVDYKSFSGMMGADPIHAADAGLGSKSPVWSPPSATAPRDQPARSRSATR